MNFGSISNDLTYTQFEKVRDIMIYYTQVSALKADKGWVETNKILNDIALFPDMFQLKF